MEDVFFTPFITPLRSAGIPRGIQSIETRTPLCDIIDKGDMFAVSLEVPGIQKDKIEVKATNEYITISGIEEEKTEKEEGNYDEMKEHIDLSLVGYHFQKILYLLKWMLQ